jgi:hypothetical protein
MHSVHTNLSGEVIHSFNSKYPINMPILLLRNLP